MMVEGDGDVMMEDVEGCCDCGFSPEEQVRIIESRQLQEQWARMREMEQMRQRAVSGGYQGVWLGSMVG